MHLLSCQTTFFVMTMSEAKRHGAKKLVKGMAQPTHSASSGPRKVFSPSKERTCFEQARGSRRQTATWAALSTSLVCQGQRGRGLERWGPMFGQRWAGRQASRLKKATPVLWSNKRPGDSQPARQRARTPICASTPLESMTRAREGKGRAPPSASNWAGGPASRVNKAAPILWPASQPASLLAS